MRYEIKKILNNRIIMVGILIVLLYTVYDMYHAFYKFPVSYNSMQRKDAKFQEYQGEYTQEKKEAIDKEWNALLIDGIDDEDKIQQEKIMEMQDLYGQILLYEECIAYRQNVLKNVQNSDVTNNVYKQRLNEKIEKAYSKELDYEIYNSDANINLTVLFTIIEKIDLFNILLIILVCTNLFIVEHEKNMYKLIYSSSKGRKILYLNKMGCAMLFSFLLAIFTTFCGLISIAINCDLSNISATIQSISAFCHSPYNIRIWKCVTIITILRGIAFVCIGMIVAIISTLFRRNIIPMLLDILIMLGAYRGCLYFGNYKPMDSIINERYDIYQTLRQYSFFPYLDDSVGYLSEFRCINVFNYPVSILLFSVVVNLLLILVLLVIGYYMYIKRFRRCGA